MEKLKFTRKLVLELPYPDTSEERKKWAQYFGLEAYIKGKLWKNRRDDEAFWDSFVKAELERQRVPIHPFTKPVKICFKWNDRLSLDNHAVMARLITKAMQGWVLSALNRQCYAACEHSFHEQEYIRIEIWEWEG